MFGWRKPRRVGRLPMVPDSIGVAERLTHNAIATQATLALLEEIEATALDVYRLHDLPTTPGHYGRSPRARQWKFLDAALTAEERFALVLANPRWRFATLETIGRDLSTDSADLATAADLLAGCAAVRACLTDGSSLPADQAAGLIHLGANWRLLGATLERRRSGALRLSFPRRGSVGRRA